MAIIRPRLNDYHDIPLNQSEIDFAIPFLDEDISLYADPFLLWKASSMQDNALHTAIVSSFNHIGHSYSRKKDEAAVSTLISLTECSEIGLGNSKTRVGKKIGKGIALEILSLFEKIPQVQKDGFHHFEEIQLLIDNISKDRISDITCSIIKSFLIDYTLDQCDKHKIPVQRSEIDVYDYKKQKINKETTFAPVNPINKLPILLVPKRWLKYIPWINYDDFFDNHYLKEDDNQTKLTRIQVLNYNRNNYDVVNAYTNIKEKTSSDLANDPLFKQIPILSSKRKVGTILKLPTGKTENADREYEDLMVQVLSSMLYPHLDFAKEQSRIDSGTQIRDLIFYNNRSYPLLQDIHNTYNCRQLVFELKNVKAVEREHINQVNRYMTDQFGSFGIIFTRNKPSKSIFQNTIDLWSGQRRCILIMDDTDLEMMNSIYESKQRTPIEVINKKYVEFMRSCPA